MLSFANKMCCKGAPVTPAKSIAVPSKKIEDTPRQYFSANGMLFTVVPNGASTAPSEAPVVSLEDTIAAGIKLSL